jgi:hypothetical protein
VVTIQEAAGIIYQNLPDGNINAGIRWEDQWIFVVYTSDADEGELDPFYSVDVATGAFSGFSIVGDQDTAGIIGAFSKALEHGDSNDDVLVHYGVKGMRWGVRRSDEELGRSRSKKSGPSKASVGAEALSNVVKPALGPFIPRASVSARLIQVGTQVAQGVATKTAITSATFGPQAIVGYTITGLDSGAYRVPGVALKNASRGGWTKDKSLSKSGMSQSEIQKKVASQINKDHPGLGTTNNCLRCTYAYEMRRRGYDVAATKTALATGQGPLGPKIMTKSLKSKTKIDPNNPNTGFKRVIKGKGKPPESQIFAALAKQPNGSRGDFQMVWGPFMGGHSIAYEIINSKPVFFDTQSGKSYSTPNSLKTLTGPARSVAFNRLDNKDLSSVAMTAWVKDNK